MDKTTVLSAFPTPSFNLLSEQAILKRWQAEDIYAQLLERAEMEHYIIQEMPAAVHTFRLDTFKCKIHQDVFLKNQMMQGKGVVYSPSWNYYAPAVERDVLNEASEDASPDALQFRKLCRRRFQRELTSRQQQFHALGMFGDWESTTKNLKSRYESKLINIFNKLRDLGYLKKDRKLGYWCQKCNTALSEDEIEIHPSQVYSGYIKFPLSEGLEEFGQNISFAVWIDDFWRLAGGVALGLKKESQYVIVDFYDEAFIISETELANYLPTAQKKNVTVIREIKAEELLNYTCAHPFLGTELPIVSLPDLPENQEGLIDEMPPSMTGVVHLVPGHHPVAHRIAEALNLPIPSVVDESGHLTEDAALFCGLNVFEVGQFIALELERRGHLICGSAREASHPHCWTCGSPVLCRPVPQWIFSPDNNQLRHRLLNSDAYWQNYNQEHSAPVQQTIEGLSNISASCYRGWSIPLPIFQCERCDNHLSDRRVLKSIRDVISRRGTDVWFKLSVDDLLPSDTLCPHCESKEFQKESALLDGRFAGLLDTVNRSDVRKTHIKHVNVAFFTKDRFPKWLAQLFLTSIALHDMLPFKYMELIPIGSQIQRADVSEEWLNQYPTDVLRLLGIHPDFTCPTMNTLAQQCEQEYQSVRGVLCLVLNELTDFEPNQHRLPLDKLLPVDTLALAATNQTVQAVDLAYQEHRFYQAWCLLKNFCESELGEFYLPLLKERLNISTEYMREADIHSLQEKQSGATALWEILRLLVQRLAPIVPFLSEQVYVHVSGSCEEGVNSAVHATEPAAFSSVFLSDWINGTDIPHISDAEAQWQELAVLRERSVGLPNPTCL
jgi:isoleucyl-tRNA synthetase